MKFGQIRRTDKRNGAKSVLRFKSLLTGKHEQKQQEANEVVFIEEQQKLTQNKLNKKQRSRRDPPGHTKIPGAIVTQSSRRTKKDCSPSRTTTFRTSTSSLWSSEEEEIDERCLTTRRAASNEFTATVDPTEEASFASLSSHNDDHFIDGDEEAGDNCSSIQFDSSFVLPCDFEHFDDDGGDISFEDPYLVSLRHKIKAIDERIGSDNHPQKQETFQSSQDETMNQRRSSNYNKTSPTNRVVSIKSLSIGHLDQRDPSSSTLRLSTSSGSSEEEGRTPSSPPKKTVGGTKLVNLGTFDFPPTTSATVLKTATVTPDQSITSSESEKVVAVKRTSKSLGAGCFDIPATDETSTSSSSSDHPHSTPGPQTPQQTIATARSDAGIGFATPLSAISKGFKALLVGSTLALPRALQFEVLARQEESPTTPDRTSEQQQHSPRMTRLLRQAAKDCEYWNKIVARQIESYGKVHAKTAGGLLQLGYAYMMAREYAQAVVAFQSACRIWNQLLASEDDQLALARVVDAIGMAWARVSQEEDLDHCQKAMTALEEAFQIRYDLLGPSHIDTVETLNKIASVHVHLREYSEACQAYWEVFVTRKAIFGPEHPSVAIAAHALGNVLVKLASTEDAANFFQIAVDIYNKMDLPNKHPAVKRLMQDYKRLDRICLTSRVPPSMAQQQRHSSSRR